MFSSLLAPLLIFTYFSYVAAQASLTPPLSLSPSLQPVSTSNATSSGNATSTSTAPSTILSGLPTCAADCFAFAVGQAGCTSQADSDCYCSQSHFVHFASNLTACFDTSPCNSSKPLTESIVEQFCAGASKSTSLSFPTTPPPRSFSNPFTSTSANSSSSTAPANTLSMTAPANTSSTTTPASTSSGQSGNSATSLLADAHLAIIIFGGALMGILLV